MALCRLTQLKLKAKSLGSAQAQQFRARTISKIRAENPTTETNLSPKRVFAGVGLKHRRQITGRPF